MAICVPLRSAAAIFFLRRLAAPPQVLPLLLIFLLYLILVHRSLHLLPISTRHELWHDDLSPPAEMNNLLPELSSEHVKLVERALLLIQLGHRFLVIVCL